MLGADSPDRQDPPPEYGAYAAKVGGMCGIFGIMSHAATSAPDASRLRLSARAMRHRGPDGEGIYSAPGLGLLHTRLALAERSEGGKQPFWDQTGRYCLVYNGELYEYEELKRELTRRGVSFRTGGDTEVLLEALIHFGVEPTLRRLEGMFAFGLYDRHNRTMVLARDRLGIKPLCVHEGPGAFMFGSSPGAFRPWLTLRPNMQSVSAYLLGFGGPTTGDSFYDQLEILPPGGVLRIRQGGKSERSRFFSLQGFADQEEAAALAAEKPARLLDRVDELLQRSVKNQLRADAPVGVLCSGGVDSSLVAAMAARSRSDLTIFHADVEGPLSECSAARALAQRLKLDFQSVSVNRSAFVDRLPDAIEHYGYPFSFHSESVAVLKVAELVRSFGVKAVLCGEGADECYFGYPWLAPTNRGRLRLPGELHRLLPAWLHKLAGRTSGGESPSANATPAGGIVHEIDRQLEIELGPASFDAWQNPKGRLAADRRKHALKGVLAYVLRTLLHRNDALGMAASVEARFPFLSNRLMYFAENLPASYKMRLSPFSFRSGQGLYCDKWIVRQLAARYLPRQFSQRKKRPFTADAYERMRISPAFFENSFLVDLFRLSRAQLKLLLARTDDALKLRLLQLDVWGRLCILQASKEVVQRRLHAHLSCPQ
jgi:asparagine synthase (glutamine-hydrolysing)